MWTGKGIQTSELTGPSGESPTKKDHDHSLGSEGHMKKQQEKSELLARGHLSPSKSQLGQPQPGLKCLPVLVSQLKRLVMVKSGDVFNMDTWGEGTNEGIH